MDKLTPGGKIPPQTTPASQDATSIGAAHHATKEPPPSLAERVDSAGSEATHPETPKTPPSLAEKKIRQILQTGAKIPKAFEEVFSFTRKLFTEAGTKVSLFFETIAKYKTSGPKIPETEPKIPEAQPEPLKQKEDSQVILRYKFDPTAEDKPSLATGEEVRTEEDHQAAFKTGFQTAANQEISLDATHPLQKVDEAVQKQIDQQPEPMLGAHFSHLDAGVVKAGNLVVYPRRIEGVKKHIFSFKLSAFAKEIAQRNRHAIETHPEDFIEALKNSPFRKNSVIIRKIDDTYLAKDQDGNFSRSKGYTPKDATATEISIEGIGKITIGDNYTYGNLSETVKIEIDSNLPDGEGIKRVNQLTAILGIGPIMSKQGSEDSERLKVAQLFRAFYPAKAIQIERKPEFYQLSVGELKNAIIQREPEMKKIFDTYLSHDINEQRARLFDAYFPHAADLTEKIKQGLLTRDQLKDKGLNEQDLAAFLASWDTPKLLEEVEVYPGRKVWAIKDLSIRMRQKGSCGLMHGVGSGTQNLKHTQGAAHAVSRIMQMGLLSSDDRFSSGLIVEGQSSDDDLAKGGGDRVFCRQVPESVIDYAIEHTYRFSGTYQMIIDQDVVNRAGCYAYRTDLFGVRNPLHEDYGQYQNRHNLIEFTKENYRNPLSGMADGEVGNEVMIKNRIPPEFIRGILCRSDDAKQELIKQLRNDGLIKKQDGNEFISGKPLDKFIRVGNKFEKEMWSK